MLIIQALYFMLPAYLANMAPVIATKIFGKAFSLPIDFNKKINGLPILGSHKTWRGLVAGIIVGILTVLGQRMLFEIEVFRNLSILNYPQINIVLVGFLFGFGVILGDAVKSFIKRRLKITSGDKWFPWDQLDFLGALALISFYFALPLPAIVFLILISPLLPLVINKIGYILGIKKVAW